MIDNKWKIENHNFNINFKDLFQLDKDGFLFNLVMKFVILFHIVGVSVY